MGDDRLRRRDAGEHQAAGLTALEIGGMKTDKINVGDVLYDVHTTRLGHTTMRGEGVWTAVVKDIEERGGIRWFLVSWNGNAARWMSSRQVSRYRPGPPEWVRGGFRGTTCYTCGNRKDEGHAFDCEHPRAVSARKRAAMR